MQVIEIDIPKADHYLPAARLLSDFLEPMANRIEKTAVGTQYALFFTNLDHQLDESGIIDFKNDQWALAKAQKRRIIAQWVEHWEQLLALANAAGWRVTRVDENGEPDFLLFTPLVEKELLIFIYPIGGCTTPNSKEQESLSAALALQGFKLISTTTSALKFRVQGGDEESAQSTVSGLEDFISNPFPNARGFLNKEKHLNQWLEVVAKLIRGQAKSTGCALMLFERPAQRVEALEAALAIYEEAGWRVTKVFAGDVLKLVFFSPLKQEELTVNLPCQDEDIICQEEVVDLTGQLLEAGFVMKESSQFQLRFVPASQADIGNRGN